MIAIPDDDLLREELAQIRWFLTASGQIQIEPKDALKSRLAGRSPDRLDSLAMAWSADEEDHGDLAGFTNEGLTRMSAWGDYADVSGF